MIEITETALGPNSEAVLTEYAQIPSHFRYSSILEVVVVNQGLEGIALKERKVPEKEKNYDEMESPTRWAGFWDLSNWVMFQVLLRGESAGGCIVAHDTKGVDMLEGRSDISVLWDIRISPSCRRRGIGSRLFAQAIRWSRSRGCKRMKIETQSNNLAACRFYARNGCDLQSIDRFHYRDHPDETQLVWSIEIN